MRNVCLHVGGDTMTKVLLVVGGVWMLFRLTDVVVTLAFGLLIFAALLPGVEALSRRMPRALAVTLVLLGGLIGLVLVVSVLLPPIVEQVGQLVASFPTYVNRVTAWFGWLTNLSERYHVASPLGAVIGSLPSRIAGFLSQTLGWTVAIASSVAALVTALVVGVFLLGDAVRLREQYLRFFPAEKRDQVAGLTDSVLRQVGTYVRGQGLVMTAVGVLTGLGLAVVGVEYAAALGLLIGVLDIIPLVGPILAAAPGLLIALGQSPTTALLALIVYVGVQQLEAQLLSPLIVGRVVGLPPVVIVVALLVGGGLLGVAGVLLAIPAAAAIQVLVSELYLRPLNPPEEPSPPTSAEREAA